MLVTSARVALKEVNKVGAECRYGLSPAGFTADEQIQISIIPPTGGGFRLQDPISARNTFVLPKGAADEKGLWLINFTGTKNNALYILRWEGSC